MKLLLITIMLFVAPIVIGGEAEDIIAKVEKNYRGDNAYIKMQIVIFSRRGERTMLLETFASGKNKSFSRLLAPKKSKGITFLKINSQLWQYIPKIERIIKIPPSMMMQNWMGTDFTNDDIVKESSIADDYDYKITNKKGNYATIELRPKEDAPVVWGKIIATINLSNYTQVKEVFYDDIGEKIRQIKYSEVEKIDGHNVATRMEVTPLTVDKKMNRTIVKIIKARFDKGVDEKYFTKRALKKYSR
jgi:outer membrane lipoprotein-sorting protein